MKRCVVCDKPITYSFWVCSECEKEYGFANKDYKNWPEWVKALVSIERRNQYVRDNIDVIYCDNEQLKYYMEKNAEKETRRF
jgi:hypothetical protein